MLHRIQLSMITEDDDLYLNFIQPLKDNKELTPTILKLLEMYYRVPEVQQIVDFSSLEDVSVDMGDSESYDEALSRAKETLAMMSLMADSASDIMSSGAVSIEEIIKHGTKIREEAGANEPVVEEFRAIEMTREPQSGNEVVQNPVISPVQDERLSKLENEVGSMKGMLEQLITMMSSGKMSVSVQSESQVVEDTESDFVENSVENVETPVETVDNSGVLDEDEEIALFGAALSTVQPVDTESVDEDGEFDEVIPDDLVPKIKTSLPKVKVDLGSDNAYAEESTEDVLARANKLLGDSAISAEDSGNESASDAVNATEVDSSSEVGESKSDDSKDGTSSLLSFLSNL